jgi:hypothetical protein
MAPEQVVCVPEKTPLIENFINDNCVTWAKESFSILKIPHNPSSSRL